MADVWKYFAHEDDYPDLDEAAVVERMAGLLRFRTVSHLDPTLTDWGEFDRLQAYMRATWPHVFSAAQVELVDHSLLLTLVPDCAVGSAPADTPGSTSAPSPDIAASSSAQGLDPVLFMGHMDVVPVVEGTEADWSYDAYSGHVDETYVWGRGSVDMKDQVAGELEAVEYALAHGWRLRRPLILAFGQDEEDLQSGAAGLSRVLRERGVHLAFVVDEGTYLVEDAAGYGAPGLPIMGVGLAEKGYADIELTVRSAGGHSSTPFGGTSLGILAEAITRIAKAPWPVALTGLDQATFAAVADAVTDPRLAPLVAGGAETIAAHADEIAQVCLADRDLNAFVVTTVAPTVIEGSSQANNVLPQDMRAVINFRILEGLSVGDVLARCQELVADLPVEVRLLGGDNEPSAVSRANGEGFAALARVAARYFRDPVTGEAVRLVPELQVGATDARSYEPICDSCLRFSAFVVDADECARGVHGTDERITRRAYLQGVRFMIGLLADSVCDPA